MAFFLACDSFVCLYDFVCISILLTEKEVRSCGENGNYVKITADTLVKKNKDDSLRFGFRFDVNRFVEVQKPCNLGR